VPKRRRQDTDLASRIIVVATRNWLRPRRRADGGNSGRDTGTTDRRRAQPLHREADILTEDLERAFKTRILHRFPAPPPGDRGIEQGTPIVADNHNKLVARSPRARSLWRPRHTPGGPLAC
jgi:hypothetical protein